MSSFGECLNSEFLPSSVYAGSPTFIRLCRIAHIHPFMQDRLRSIHRQVYDVISNTFVTIKSFYRVMSRIDRNSVQQFSPNTSVENIGRNLCIIRQSTVTCVPFGSRLKKRKSEPLMVRISRGSLLQRRCFLLRLCSFRSFFFV